MNDGAPEGIFVCDEHGAVAVRAGEPHGCDRCRRGSARLRMTPQEVTDGYARATEVLTKASPLFRIALTGHDRRRAPLTCGQLRRLLRAVWEHGEDYGVAKQLEEKPWPDC